MLSILKITNLALVESLTWDLGDGLVCVTGETGAGKSIIVGAIRLVLGDRVNEHVPRPRVFEEERPHADRERREAAGPVGHERRAQRQPQRQPPRLLPPREDGPRLEEAEEAQRRRVLEAL